MRSHSMQASLSRVSTCRCLCESCRRIRLAMPRRAFRRSGTDGSNPVPSSGESTNHRFLGGGAASAVCHEPAPLYARAAANDAHNRGLQKARGGGAVPPRESRFRWSCCCPLSSSSGRTPRTALQPRADNGVSNLSGRKLQVCVTKR